MIKTTKTFIGSMDHDSEDHLISPEDYRLLVDGENDARVKRGVVKNVKSNILINNPYLQNGENIVIGSKEDITDGSCIYFVYNSNGYHSIFQYFRNLNGYPMGRIDKLVQPRNPQLYTLYNENPLNFSSLQPHMITGINLVDGKLVFTDYRSRSKVVDIVRANETGKRRRFNIIFNAVNFDPYTSPSTYTLDVYQSGNPVPISTLTWQGTGALYVDRVSQFVTAFRNSGLTTFNVIACGEHAIVEMVQEGPYHVQLSEVHLNVANASVAVPENFYPDKDLSLPVSFDLLSRDLFDELCYVPRIQPRVAYVTDTTRKINLVKNRLFQFAIRYQLFDYSWGVFGARSKIALPQRSCGDENNFGNTNNYLLVDFTDPRLENPALVSIIRKAELIVNEPAIDGIWKSVKIFEQHEIAGLQAAKFKFYNDGNYPAIPATVIVKQFDDLFIKFKSKEFVGNRQFAAGGVEGYDGPCVNAAVTVTYEAPQLLSGRYEVTGHLGIQSLLNMGGSNGQNFQQQITYQTGAAPGITQWGGFGRAGSNAIAAVGQASGANYEQEFAPGVDGFVAYLAGTPYYGISKQVIPAADLQINPGFPPLVQDPNTGALLLGGGGGPNQLWALLDKYFVNQTIIRQEFTIPNVPNGHYILRIASHRTTNADLGTSLAYQRTSTNAYVYPNFTTQYEQEIVVNNGNITTLPWIVHDLNDMSGDTAAVCAYVVADDIPGFNPTNVQDYMNETRIELSRVRVIDSNGAFYPPVKRADHNGYIYATNEVLAGSPDVGIALLFSGQYSTAPAASINVVSGAPWAFVPNGNGRIGAFRSTSADIKNNGRTRLIGNVYLTGTTTGQGNVNVVNTQGGTDITDGNGYYEIITYPFTPGGLLTYGERNGKIIFSAASGLCLFNFSPDSKIDYGPGSSMLQISSNAPPDYNLANPYTLANEYVDVVVITQAVSRFKRGGDYKFGLVYYDEGDRKCAVVTSDELQKHILFYTEKDSSGNIPLRGLPVVNWMIKHPPPEWAVKYQWVVTTNLQLSRYLQWIGNKIEYVDEDDNLSNPFNAAFVKINLDNIGFYTTVAHPDAVIDYTPVKGDRIRFIADQNGIGYNDYYDFEILKAVGTTVYIYAFNTLTNLAAGTFFELYTPKGINANNLFFEFGECYDVKEAMFFGVRKKYHAGPIQNQSFGPMPLQTVTPALGRFSTGDVYYRLRSLPINIPAAPPYGPFSEKLLAVDDASASDFYPSRANGFGRVSVDSPEIGEVDSPDVIRLGNLYIPGIKANGYRNYDALNRKQLSTDYGLINKLQMNGNNVLNAFCENSATLSMYIDKSVLRQAVNSPLVAIAEAVINNAEKYQRSFGTVNAESVQVNDEADIFAWDENKSIVLRSSGNGLIPISDYKLISTFNEIGRRRNALKYKNSKVVGTYHVDRDIYILSFNSLQPFPGIKPFVRFPVPQLETGGSITYPVNPMVKVTVMPLNIDLVNAPASDPDFPNTGNIILNNVNTGASGWTASLDADGFITLTAPAASNVYSNNEIILRINYNVGSNTFFKQYTYNLSQAVLPSVEKGPGYEGETFVFCKDKNGWIQKYSFVPEYYGRIKGEILQFVNGELWLHEAGPDYNTYFNVYHNRRLDFIFTGEKDVISIKQFKALSLNTKAEHFCPELITPPDQLFPTGMRSQLRKSNFKLIQGKFYSDILRDETTPGFTNPNLALLNGRPMVGQNLKVRLENDNITESELLECQLQYFHSEYS